MQASRERGPGPMVFEEVYDVHFEFVWRSLRQLGVAEHDASDAAQDVFIVVHSKLAEFEGRSKMATWLFGICIRVAAGRRRLAHVRREVPGVDGVDDATDESADVAAEAERREGLALLE